MYFMNDECFMCTNDDNCVVIDDQIVHKVEYLLPEITIIKLNIPLHICSTCETNLHSFSKFKQVCVENTQRLEARIKKAQTCDVPGTHLKEDNSDTTVENAALGTSVQKLKEILPLEDSTKLPSGSMSTKNAVSNTQLSTDNANTKDKIAAPETNNQTFEQIFIKEEPLEEIISDEFCDEKIQNEQEETRTIDSNDTRLNNQSKTKYHCSICNQSFPRQFQLIIHKRTHVEIKNFCKKFQCSLCGKLFTDKSNLKKHVKIHNPTKYSDFKCNDCNKFFKDNSNLRRHLKTHLGIKNFQCNLCKKLFTANTSLIRHMKTHSGTRDFQCNVCKKLFTQSGSLKTHMKIHKNIKDFQCMICKKSFTQSCNLKTHMKNHDNEETCVCFICNTVFNRRDELKEHLKICRKNASKKYQNTTSNKLNV